MAAGPTKKVVSGEVLARLVAPLTPNSWDPDAREDANNPALLAALAEARRQGDYISQEALDRKRPLTSEEVAEAEAALDDLERNEAAALQAEVAQTHRGRRGRRPSTVNGKVLLRLPLSVHRELIERAEAEQTSLNQLVLAYVSRGLGQDAGVVGSFSSESK